MKQVRIALTSGCSKGIGPEIAVAVAERCTAKCDLTIYGNSKILRRAAELRGIEPNFKIHDVGSKNIDPFKLTDEECGQLSLEILDRATDDVLQGKHSALVTCPINKDHWHRAGSPAIGHTEFLANKCDSGNYAMMMASPKLKVTLATIHTAVKNIATELTEEKIIKAARITHDSLMNFFGLKNPRIAVAALNPHCGDNGLLGDEEKKIIEPAIARLREMGINAFGPYSGDAIFAKAVDGEFDAVISMYHDQGLAAIKTLDNKNTVNVTLGLPIIRTSVDHGTAEDIAWKGIADESNLLTAIDMAIFMATNRR